MLTYPDIDPVALRLGPVAIRWYGLMYLFGFTAAYFLVKRRLARTAPAFTGDHVQGLMFWAMAGLLVGARLGEIVFYQWTDWTRFLRDPIEIIAIWRGGMSFHGGLIGAVAAALIYLRRQKLPFLPAADAVCLAAPWALMFGRIGNFINGELFGRVSDLPWAMVFPHGGPLPRHPSQLYEAVLEGPALFALLWLMRDRAPTGGVVALFLFGYALARFLVEFVREPDAWLGFLALGLTMGQWLSLAMAAAGALYLAWLRARAGQAPPIPAPPARPPGKDKPAPAKGRKKRRR
ncbi:MAG: prolipoprotein diacylglyceryl transferase [Thermodesulfobacteriota bacterium]